MDKDYIVIEAKTAEELTAKVRELIGQRYRPVDGGFFVIPSGKGVKLYQAVQR